MRYSVRSSTSTFTKGKPHEVMAAINFSKETLKAKKIPPGQTCLASLGFARSDRSSFVRSNDKSAGCLLFTCSSPQCSRYISCFRLRLIVAGLTGDWRVVFATVWHRRRRAAGTDKLPFDIRTQLLAADLSAGKLLDRGAVLRRDAPAGELPLADCALRDAKLLRQGSH